MGQVIEADDVFLRRTVAIKVLTLPSRAARRRFVQEARLTAMLSHPGVVPVHDVGETPDGRPFFAMKRIRGRSLHEVIHTGGMPSLSERLDVFKRVCEAVAFAHDAGVLHLDLKPDNVMVGDYGEVLVVDWGLAAEVGDGGQAVRQVAGTPAYMAPEQATQGAPLDRRADVYALGAVLFELLTDRPPIDAGAVTEMLQQVRTGAIRSPRQLRASVPRELDALVQLAMSKDPDRRPANALLLRDEVRAFQEHRELQTLSYGLWSRVAKWRQRNRALVLGVTWASAAGFALLVTATALYVLSVDAARRRAEEQERIARQEKAQAELYLGLSHLTAERPAAATEALARARTTLESLGHDTAAVELALVEAGAAGSRVDIVPLPWKPRHLVTNGRVVAYHDTRGHAGWLDLDTETAHEGPPDVYAVDTALGLAWWHFVETPNRLVAVDDSWSVTLPFHGRAHVFHDTVYNRVEQEAYVLSRGADGAVALDPTPSIPRACPDGTYRAHTVRCGDGEPSIDLRSGDRLGSGVLTSTPDGTYVLDGSAFRAEVYDTRTDEIVWTSTTRPFLTSAGRDHTALRDEHGRTHVRRWRTGEPLLDIAAHPEVDGRASFVVLPTRRLAVAGVKEGLALQRPAEKLVSLGERAVAAPHVTAAGPHGFVAAETHRIRRVDLDHRAPAQVDWTEADLPSAPRDAAWGPGGELAVATRRSGVTLIQPDGTVARHDLEGCCLAVAWRDDTLGAIGVGGVLHELRDGTWTPSDAPVVEHGAWDIVPWGGDGWAVSDYGGPNDVLAVTVRDGQVVDTIHGAEGLSFDVASDGERVVVASASGTFLWDGEAVTQLDTTHTTAATWTPYGPATAGADRQVRIFSPTGGLLHTWDRHEAIISMAWTPWGLTTASLNGARLVPVTLP